MRRSAAPSSQSAAKRLRFLSSFINSAFEIDENDIFNNGNSKCDTTVSKFVPKKLEDTTSTHKDSANSSVRSSDEVKFLLEPSTEDDKNIFKEDILSPAGSSENRTSATCKDKASSSVRSTDEILKYLFEPVTDADISTDKDDVNTVPEYSRNLGVFTKPLNVTKRKSMAKDDEGEVRKFTSDQNVDSAGSDPSVCYYNVLYCKRSAKKHKVWEGDGILIIKNRSAVLKNSLGKVIDRGIGYKLKEIEAIEDGGKFFIGGKECEIQFQIPPEEYKTLESPEPPESDSLVPPKSSIKPNICM